MKNKIIISLTFFFLIACVVELEYTLSDIEDAVIIEGIYGNYKSVTDSAKVEFKIQEDRRLYDIYFKDENDSIIEKHEGFFCNIEGDYFLNFNTTNELKPVDDQDLYQFYKLQDSSLETIKLSPVSDSLFKDRSFESEQAFRAYFKSHLNDPALVDNKKDSEIKLKKVN